jgi:C-terminal processing protease CtpA/Prc
LRALIVGAILAAVGVVLTLTLVPARVQPVPSRPRDRTTQSFWLGTDPREVQGTVVAAAAAFDTYIKRDTKGGDIRRVAAEFANINSEADLIQTFRMLATASGDEYIGLLTNEQYLDRLARLGGGKIGVDAEVSWDFSGKKFTFTQVGPTAAAQGLKQGEEITQILGMQIPKDANGWQIAQQVNILLQRGLLNSKLEVVVQRDGKDHTVPLTRVVTSRAPAFDIAAMQHPLSNKPMDDAKVLTFHHLRSETLLTDLYQQLRTLQDQNVRGMIVDLREVGEGDTETAVRIAAMFQQDGPLGSFIQTTPEGTLVMRSYEIAKGKVQVKTDGPFTVGEDGKIASTPLKPQRIEVTDWPCNVFRGQVTAVQANSTLGGGEVIAAAFTHSWLRDRSRTQTVAKEYTRGKGTQQTYFQVGNKYWLRVSTSFTVQPDGSPIEGERGPGPDVACPPDQDEHWYARFTLFKRMSVLPHSDYPADRR